MATNRVSIMYYSYSLGSTTEHLEMDKIFYCLRIILFLLQYFLHRKLWQSINTSSKASDTG